MNGASSSESSFDFPTMNNVNEHLPETQGVVAQQRDKENTSPQPAAEREPVALTERTASPLAVVATGDLASGSLDDDEDDDLEEVQAKVSKLSVSQKAEVAAAAVVPAITYGNEDFEAQAVITTTATATEQRAPAQSFASDSAAATTTTTTKMQRDKASAWQPLEDDLIDVSENQFADSDFEEEESAAAEFAAVAESKSRNNRFTRMAANDSSITQQQQHNTPLDVLMLTNDSKTTTPPQHNNDIDNITSGEFVKQHDVKVIMATVAAELQHAQEPYVAARLLLRASVSALQDLRVSNVLEDYDSMSRAYDSIGKVHAKAKTRGLDETLQAYRIIEPSRALGAQLRSVFASKRAPFVDVYYAHKHAQCSADALLKVMTGIAHVAAATLACREALPAFTAWTHSVIQSASAHSASFDVYKTQSFSRIAFDAHVNEASAVSTEAAAAAAAAVPRLSRFQRLAMLNEDLK